MPISINGNLVDIAKIVSNNFDSELSKPGWAFFGGIAISLHFLHRKDPLRDHKDIDIVIINKEILDHSRLHFLNDDNKLEIVNNYDEYRSNNQINVECFYKEVPNFIEASIDDFKEIKIENNYFPVVSNEFLFLSQLLLTTRLEDREWFSIGLVANTFEFQREKIEYLCKKTKFGSYVDDSFMDSMISGKVEPIFENYRRILGLIQKKYCIKIDVYDFPYLLEFDHNNIRSFLHSQKYFPQDITDFLISYYVYLSKINVDKQVLLSILKNNLFTNKKVNDCLKYLCIINELLENKHLSIDDRVRVNNDYLEAILYSQNLFRYTYLNNKLIIKKY